MRSPRTFALTACAALASLAACVAPEEGGAAAAAAAVEISPGDAIDLASSPCRDLLERVYGPGDEEAGVRALGSLADVDAMLADRSVVWPNHPAFLDADAPAMRVATVSLVTGEVTIFDVSTARAGEALAPGARALARAGQAVRVGRPIWRAQALLGGRLGRSASVPSSRASFRLRGGAQAVARPASLDDVEACFDGRQGLLVDDQGVPRASLSPPVILRMWTATYRNPYFAPPVAPDRWSRPEAPGTRHILAKFQVRARDGAMQDSSVNSDYTIHEVPPTVCYETDCYEVTPSRGATCFPDASSCSGLPDVRGVASRAEVDQRREGASTTSHTAIRGLRRGRRRAA